MGHRFSGTGRLVPIAPLQDTHGAHPATHPRKTRRRKRIGGGVVLSIANGSLGAATAPSSVAATSQTFTRTAVTAGPQADQSARSKLAVGPDTTTSSRGDEHRRRGHDRPPRADLNSTVWARSPKQGNTLSSRLRRLIVDTGNLTTGLRSVVKDCTVLGPETVAETPPPGVLKYTVAAANRP